MQPWKLADYRHDPKAEPDRVIAKKVFDLVWRFDCNAPGFALLDIC